ncbi:Y+L amino acid transporter 2 [Manis javanica]|nr:Y+L amino acid transporter 2 [Manis javanica]
MNSGDVPPVMRNIICLMQHGTCRLFFCFSGEKKDADTSEEEKQESVKGEKERSRTVMVLDAVRGAE